MLPNTLYKYRKWDCKFHKNILLKNEIYFSSAVSFNDPFDSTIPIKYDQATKDQIYDYYLKHVSKVYKYHPKSKIHNIVDDCIKRGYYYQPTHQKWLRFFHQRKRFRDYGIFSTTPQKDNIIMWSHYSDSHKGFCIGFNTQKMLEFFKQNKILYSLHEITYCPNYPSFKPVGNSADDPLLDPLIIKSSNWKYENEYRFIWLSESNKNIKLKEGLISEVILGCKMPIEYKNEIKDIIFKKSQSIQLLESQIKEDDFGLNFNKITC